MATGTIKTIVTDKGFGFIEVPGSDNNVFFHHSSLAPGQFEGLRVGQSVSFDMEEGPKGPKASNVVVVEAAAA